MKSARSLIHFDLRSFGLGLLVGCILVTLTYCSISKNADMLITNRLADIVDHAGSVSDKIVETHQIGHGRDAAHYTANKMNRSGISTGAISYSASEKMEKSGEGIQMQEIKPLCDFSHFRSAICDINGDIRIIGKNLSSVIVINPNGTERNESWKVRPYARKWDKGSLNHVREVNVKYLDVFGGEAPQCTVSHSVPAIVFAISGFAGNYFHDFTDLLVPLFQTARQFNGEVKFVVANNSTLWIHKYLPFIQKLSNYDIINYDNDDRVHCFKHVIVGLRSDRDMTIDPANSPNGYSMVDFMKFMRTTYGLKRDTAISLSEEPGKKPRLLIISRRGTRQFVNLNEIVDTAMKVGYEVVITEASFDLANFSRIVNSCDVMMGVHGAGLTNFVFLPMNAVLIQVVPFGKLDWIATTYFGEPLKQIKNMGYLEYTISKEESSLIELYPRDDPVLTDPKSIHKLGWNKMGEIYLDKQNIKLNVTSFRYVLIEALNLLSRKN